MVKDRHFCAKFYVDGEYVGVQHSGCWSHIDDVVQRQYGFKYEKNQYIIEKYYVEYKDYESYVLRIIHINLVMNDNTKLQFGLNVKCGEIIIKLKNYDF
jgi:hypothetical protein